MSIELISFDLDDTLWAVDPVMIQANLRLYRWLEQNAPALTERYDLQQLAALRDQIARRQPEIAHSVSATRLAVLKQGLTDSGYGPDDADSLAEAAFEVFLIARNQVEPFEHALPMLSELSGQYRLAALSNGNADIDRVGLGNYFEFALSADQVGQAKPHPLMFEQLVDLAGLQPEQVLHIGDHPDHDIAGAQACGLHTLWVNFSGQPWPGQQAPDLEVSCLSQIVSDVRKYNSDKS